MTDIENSEPWVEENLTPTQELVMEVLQARLRLGETCWTFSSRLKKQIEDLAKKGEISYKDGCAGGLLVFPKDRQKLLSHAYKIPILEGYISKSDLVENYVPKEYVEKAKIDFLISANKTSISKQKKKNVKNKDKKNKKSKKNKKNK